MPQTTIEPVGSPFGLIAATFTAFHPDGAVHLERIEQQAEALSRQGLRGAFVCGSTGEGSSLTGAERMDIVERWRQAAGADLEIIVHVGHASIGEARILAAHAERHEAAGIAAIAPYYFRPKSVPDLVACCAEVAAAAPRTPFYYYHIPEISQVHLPMAAFLPLAAAAIPNFAGIKFTDADLADYALCIDRAADRYELFFGRDEFLLAGISVGARAAVGSTYNFAAPIYQRAIDAFRRGDAAAAREAQLVATRMIDTGVRYGGLPAFKAMMAWFGPDCGPCRLPLAPLDATRLEQLRADLDEQGFFAEVARAPLATAGIGQSIV